MKLKAILSERRLFYVNLALITFLLGVAVPVVNIVGHRAVASNAIPVVANDSTATGTQFKAMPALLNIGPMQNSFRQIVSKVLPTVVEVNVVDVVKQSQSFQSPFDFLFGAPSQPQSQKQYGLGSGVMVRQNGDTVYVLTNNHVAGNAQEISVKLNDGRQFKATLVGKDPNRDLAVIEFHTSERVPIASLGNSNDIAPGDWVLAMGNPLGFQSTVTAGIVSALDRQAAAGSNLGTYTDYIQTDAAINPGNSGGALVDMQGNVVGINTWIASKTGGSNGIGFAIPMNVAKKVMNDIIKSGHVVYGWTGVSVGDPTQIVTDNMGLSGSQGAMVYDVYRNSPAAQAGMQPGDFITKVNGNDVTDASQLLYTIANMDPGATADFSVIRRGQNINVSVVIGKRLDGRAATPNAQLMWPGMAVLPITADIQSQIGLPNGVGNVIIGSVQEGSIPAQASFQPGDVIQSINGKRIGNLKDFYAAINDPNTNHFVFRIYRQGTELILGMNNA